MSSSSYPEITDELLSSYIDGAVNDNERSRVESAASRDADVAWRLETLQQTVMLLGQMSEVALSQNFILPLTAADQAQSGPSAPLPVDRKARAAQSGGFRERWREFWTGGSPVLRNAMAASMALLFVLLIGDQLLPAPANLDNIEFAQGETGEVLEQNEPEQAPTAAIALVAPQQADWAAPSTAKSQGEEEQGTDEPATETQPEPATADRSTTVVAPVAADDSSTATAAAAAPAPTDIEQAEAPASGQIAAIQSEEESTRAEMGAAEMEMSEPDTPKEDSDAPVSMAAAQVSGAEGDEQVSSMAEAAPQEEARRDTEMTIQADPSPVVTVASLSSGLAPASSPQREGAESAAGEKAVQADASVAGDSDEATAGEVTEGETVSQDPTAPLPVEQTERIVATQVPEIVEPSPIPVQTRDDPVNEQPFNPMVSAQLLAAIAVLVFGLLWLRSRNRNPGPAA